MSAQIVKIHSLEEYVREITALYEDSPEGPARNELLYRGQYVAGQPLLPSIYRSIEERENDGEHVITGTLLIEERTMIETAKRKLPDIFLPELKPLELLALLQHYGIPTRLMDLSENAFVGLYFACEDRRRKYSGIYEDGEVIVFKHERNSIVDTPVMEAIAESYKFADKNQSLVRFYENMVRQSYCAENSYMMTEEIVGERSKERFIMDHCRGVNFVNTTIRSRRQYSQDGRYILFANDIDKVAHRWQDRISELKRDDENIYKIIQVDRDAKETILKHLEMFGTRKSKLFADNVDIICEEIRDKSMIR
ncbi:MAG: FRG domain-containing protein [Lachnospiraceae bacterium]|nr:FRG domain-containing protein [Lachnospiraceae bacterium]